MVLHYNVVIYMCCRHATLTQAQVRIDDPFFRRSMVGGRAFPAAEAKVWNSLPSDVTSAPSLPVFRNRLITYLFRRCYDTV